MSKGYTYLCEPVEFEDFFILTRRFPFIKKINIATRYEVKKKTYCKCNNREIVEMFHPSRQEVLNNSEHDRINCINSRGTLANDNAYGEIVSRCKDCGKTTPIICMHGGSMWLCRQCKEDILKEEQKRIKQKTKKGDVA